MNPTSSLIAGGVLLFGALSLANIYMPTYRHTEVPPHLYPRNKVVSLMKPGSRNNALSAKPAAVLQPEPQDTTQNVVSALGASSTTSATNASAAPNSKNSAQTSDNNTAIPKDEPNHVQTSITPNTGSSTDIFSKRPTTNTRKHLPQRQSVHKIAKRRAIENSQQRRAIARRRYYAVKVKHARSVLHAEHKSRFDSSARAHRSMHGFTLSAILGGHAWIRVGNMKTVRVTAGDTIPGIGKVVSISNSEVKFSNGDILRN